MPADDAAPALRFFDRHLIEARNFWTAALAVLAHEVDESGLPLDRPRPSQPGDHFHRHNGSVSFEIAGAGREHIRRLTQDQPLLVYALFVAAATVVLHKITGSRAIVIGSPAWGDEAGPNALPILSRVDPAMTFRTLLRQVRQALLDAYSHQSYPFTAMVKDAGALAHEPPAGHRCPLFDIAMSLAGYHRDLPPVSDLRHDLTVHLAIDQTRARAELVFNDELFDPGSVERLAHGIRIVLDAALEDSHASIGRFDLLTPEDRHHILHEWNTTAAPVAEGSVLRMFEAHADRSPDATAVACDGRTLSYGELDRRAGELAGRLRSLGVGPEVLVGLCAGPTLARVVGVLGILKAGGAFLPLDPNYPSERLALMLDDARVAIVIADRSAPSELPATVTDLLRLDEPGSEATTSTTSREDDRVEPDPEHLAYVIYTSGSTGRPKGVACRHRGLANLAAAQMRAFDVRSSSRVLQFASLSFDASVSEMAMALCAGATLVLAEREALFPGDVLVRFLREERITHVTLMPSVLALMPAAPLPDLTTLVVAGEACPAELVAQWAAGRRFINAYGPTETTVCATLDECRRGGEKPSIGRPMANVEVYIVDEGFAPVPPGVTGELCVGGVGLARGYWNNPAATAGTFIPHPFSDIPGARLYRTGDRARFLPDGRIDFQGRADTQVKLRGFRIELGEIESVLAAHPLVREAAVLCREDEPGVRRLVAYIAPLAEHPEYDGPAGTEAALRRHLESALPAYMRPEAFVILSTLPQTSKLTVARDRLPPPVISVREAAAGLIPARDATELALVHIWERVLGTSPIGVRDNFFELGGHSFLAVKLLLEIRQRFDSDLPLAALLRTPTVEELAVALRDHRPDAPWSPLVPIREAGSRPPIFCVHPAGGSVLCYADLAAALGGDQPFYGVQELGLADGQTPLDTIEQMADLYVHAILGVQADGPYLLAGWSLGGLIAFEMAHQLRAGGREVRLLALFDTYAPAAVSERIQALDDVQRLLSLFGEDVQLSEERLRRLDETGRLEYVLEKARQINLVPPGFGVADARRLLRVFVRNSEAAAAYRPKTYDGAVTLFTAGHKSAAVTAMTTSDPLHGWGALARDGVRLEVVEGSTHHEMMRKPQVQILAERLRGCVEAVYPSHEDTKARRRLQEEASR